MKILHTITNLSLTKNHYEHHTNKRRTRECPADGRSSISDQGPDGQGFEDDPQTGDGL